MIPKKERLSRQEFNRFFSLGKRHHGTTLMLVHSPSPQFQAGAVISKKIAKTAVARNKFRRRIYDALGRMQQEHGFTGVFIIIAKAGATSHTYNALKAELTSLVHKTGNLG